MTVERHALVDVIPTVDWVEIELLLFLIPAPEEARSRGADRAGRARSTMETGERGLGHG